MRTKTLFLAAAALAAGLASSQAQSNVYSVNVVGYINVPLVGGQQVLLENGLDNGTNTLVSIDNGAIPNKSTVNVWNGTGFSFTSKSAGVWGQNFAIAPGQAFFVKPASACTLTLVGSAPTSNNWILPANVQTMIGARVPIAGNVTNSGANTLNLGPSMPNKTTFNLWNGTGFTFVSKTAGTYTTNFNVQVAGGFFVKPAAAATWKQWLQ